MQNRYFTEPDLAVLADPRRWRLAGPSFATTPADPLPRYQRWMRRHQHTHTYAEAMIALAGQTVYGIEGQIYPCRPGSVFIFEPDRAHDVAYPPWAPPLRHLWISFIQDKVMARIVAIRAGRIRSGGNLQCLIEMDGKALKRQETCPASEPALPPHFIRLRCWATLINIVAALMEEGYRQQPADQRDAVQKQKINAICRQIMETGGAGASLDHLAQIAGYSNFHFLRIFRRHTGRTVHAYVNQARRRKVVALCANGVPLKAISAELGFSCPAAFSRWYRPFKTQITR